MKNILLGVMAIALLSSCGHREEKVADYDSDDGASVLTNGYALDFEANPMAFELPAKDKNKILATAADSIAPSVADSVGKEPCGTSRWVDRAALAVDARYGIPNKKKLTGSNLDHQAMANVEYNSLQLINYLMLNQLKGTNKYDLLAQEGQLVDSLIAAQNVFLRSHFQYECAETDSNSWRLFHNQEMEWQSLYQAVLMAVNSPQEVATYPRVTEQQIDSEYDRLANSLSENKDSCYNVSANREALSHAKTAWDQLNSHHAMLKSTLPDSTFHGLFDMLRFKQYVRLKNSFQQYASDNLDLSTKLIKEDGLLK
ncbi:MAG: hypothetical protein LIP03_09350 [Bacteroidales bacterium]|nr:hypothetical protein [Bacteroidales bacterium]